MNAFVALIVILLQLLQLPSFFASTEASENVKAETEVHVKISRARTDHPDGRFHERISLDIVSYDTDEEPAIPNDCTLIQPTTNTATSTDEPRLVVTDKRHQKGEIRLEGAIIPIQLAQNLKVYVRDRRKSEPAQGVLASPRATIPQTPKTKVRETVSQSDKQTRVPANTPHIHPALLVLAACLAIGLLLTKTPTLHVQLSHLAPHFLIDRYDSLAESIANSVNQLCYNWKSSGDRSESDDIKYERLFCIGLSGLFIGAASCLLCTLFLVPIPEAEPWLKAFLISLLIGALLLFGCNAISNNIRRRGGWPVFLGCLTTGSLITYLGLAYRLGLTPF